jgi:hypothetical protein
VVRFFGIFVVKGSNSMKKKENRIEYINHDTDEQMVEFLNLLHLSFFSIFIITINISIKCIIKEIYGFTKSILGNIITWIFVILSLGFLRLVFYWKPRWMLLCTHRECSIKAASKVLLRDKYQQWFVEEILTVKLNNNK